MALYKYDKYLSKSSSDAFDVIPNRCHLNR